jgi:hypothetical protein
MERADAEFWLQVPASERAALVWELSLEAFILAGLWDRERRLSRSDFRPQQR